MKKKDHPGTVIIIDNGVYRRTGIEELIAQHKQHPDVYSFECVTDYRQWQGAVGRRYESGCLMINTTTPSLFGEDIVSLLKYEQAQSEHDAAPPRLLLITDTVRPLKDTYLQAAEYLLEEESLRKRVEVRNISALSLKQIDALIRYVSDGVRRTSSTKITVAAEKMTSADIRISRILFSGRGLADIYFPA